jgi:hypothetical protein
VTSSGCFRQEISAHEKGRRSVDRRPIIQSNEESEHTAGGAPPTLDAAASNNRLPNRLRTAFEVAEFIGCHEETVRRAYLRELLKSQRFGVRGRRFHPADVLDWIKRGAPTRVS